MSTKVNLVSFATPKFRAYQEDLVKSARKFGISDFYTFTYKDLIRTSFFKKHSDIFSYNRGCGYWLWKPYFILEVLEKINDGDILFYADSGCLFINDPSPLIEICRNNQTGIVAFDAWPLTNNQWCKRDAFILTNCDTEDDWFAKHVIATTMLFRKNANTITFVKQWLEFCSNKHAITEIENIYGLNLQGFVRHMGDQPIFSLLINKFKIPTYRNPSKWGNFLKTSEFKVPYEYIGYPYGVEDSVKEYSETPYCNSPYKTILEFNRQQQSGTRTIYEKILNKIFKVFKKTN